MGENWEKIGESQHNETWDPQTQKEISGFYVEKKTDIGPNKANKYVLDVGNEKNVEVWGSSGLDGKMSRCQIGDEIKITYLGMAKNPRTNRTFHNYELYRRKGVKKNEVDADDLPFS